MKTGFAILRHASLFEAGLDNSRPTHKCTEAGFDISRTIHLYYIFN